MSERELLQAGRQGDKDAFGRLSVFLAHRVFATPWRLFPARVNGQLAFASYQGDQDGEFKLGSLTVLTLRGKQITELTAFLDPAVNGRFAARSLRPVTD